jgi:GTP-binding protein HflX
MWTHLSRQTGGIGTRGPGETQLEVDRRRIQERIFRLEKDLREVRKHRSIQREGRDRHHWPVCALVGYTNAGKSTFMNRLTAAQVLAADRLFATLDPTIRQFTLPNRQKVLLADTVGFLQKLPHNLVESFRATLEEVREADILFHIIDASNEDVEGQIQAVESVLRQIDAHDKQTMHIFNKKDMVTNEIYLEHLVSTRSHAVAVSALTGEGMDAFYTEIERMLRSWRMQVRLRLPQSEGGLLAEVQRAGHVLELRYEGNEVLLTAHIPPLLENRLRPYILSHEPAHPRNRVDGPAPGAAGPAGGGGADDLGADRDPSAHGHEGAVGA